MEKVKERITHYSLYVTALLKWLAVGALVGGVGGFVGALFHLGVDCATPTSAWPTLGFCTCCPWAAWSSPCCTGCAGWRARAPTPSSSPSTSAKKYPPFWCR